jgi:phospholipase/carboxylesterase
MPSTNKIHSKNIITAGVVLQEAKKALIMVHGRGGSAEVILSLADNLGAKDFALLAPQANNKSWYPYSFMAPESQNEPWLSSALALLKETVNEALLQGITEENIYFAGFSQGACLTLEFVARNAKKYGGVAAFTGGLIGDRIHAEKYKGDFNKTPVFIGTSDPDPHVPVERVYATTKILKSMNASVTEKVYENMGHTIIMDEIELANKLVFASA